MFNYRGVIVGKVPFNSKAAGESVLVQYYVLVPVLSSEEHIVAYCLTLPGSFLEYSEGQTVVVSELASQEYFILGLLQDKIVTNSNAVANLAVQNLKLAGGEIASEVRVKVTAGGAQRTVTLQQLFEEITDVKQSVTDLVISSEVGV